MSGFPDPLPSAVRRALRQVEEFNRQTRAAQAALDGLAPIRAQLPALNEAFWHAMQPRRWREQWERALPENWRGMSSDEVKRVTGLMDRTSWSLIWVPCQDTLERLLKSRTKDPGRRLIRFEKRIVADLDVSLRKISAPEVRSHRGALREGLAMHQERRFLGAQALAAAVLTDAVHEFFDPPTLGEVRRKGSNIEPEEVSIQHYRRALMFQRVAEGLAIFRRETDPIPTRFNRHAVAHTIAPEQFTRANSLAGLLLNVTVARELQWEIDERHRLGTSPPSSA